MTTPLPSTSTVKPKHGGGGCSQSGLSPSLHTETQVTGGQQRIGFSRVCFRDNETKDYNSARDIVADVLYS